MTSIDRPSAGHNLVRNEASGRLADRPRDPLPRLLAQISARFGGHCTVLRAASRPWASALFEGRRHMIVLAIEGANAPARCDAFAHGLAQAEWTLPGHFVADIVVDDQQATESGERVELSALTIRDW